jgi:hypothetical protein
VEKYPQLVIGLILHGISKFEHISTLLLCGTPHWSDIGRSVIHREVRPSTTTSVIHSRYLPGYIITDGTAYYLIRDTSRGR